MPPKRKGNQPKSAEKPKYNCKECGSFLRKDMGCTNCERANDIQPLIAVARRNSSKDHKVFDQLQARAASFF